MGNLIAFVVEDDKHLALAFAESLQSANFEVEIFHDGEAAKKRLSEVPPALVILDLHLPYVSGAELLDFIRSNAQFANTRVIVASADALASEEVRHKADLVLLKPIGYRQLKDLAIRLIR